MSEIMIMFKPVILSLPAPQFPPIQKTNTGLLRDALTVAIVAYVVSVSIAKALAKKTREKINSNQVRALVQCLIRQEPINSKF